MLKKVFMDVLSIFSYELATCIDLATQTPLSYKYNDFEIFCPFLVWWENHVISPKDTLSVEATKSIK